MIVRSGERSQSLLSFCFDVGSRHLGELMSLSVDVFYTLRLRLPLLGLRAIVSSLGFEIGAFGYRCHCTGSWQGHSKQDGPCLRRPYEEVRFVAIQPCSSDRDGKMYDLLTYFIRWKLSIYFLESISPERVLKFRPSLWL